MTEAKGGQGAPANLSEVRDKLNKMTGRITSRLKDRTLFPSNRAVYEPDAIHIDGRSGVSLLQFAIEGLETYHASLGRFDYVDQFPVLGRGLPHSSVERVLQESSLQDLKIDVTDKLLPFYRDLTAKYCKPGDDPTTYGETAYVDADLLQVMHERINLGRFVADVKERNDPSVYEAKEDEELLVSKLRDRKREGEIIDEVRAIAERYQVSPDMAEEVFRWMIDRTMDVEVEYIQKASKPQ